MSRFQKLAHVVWFCQYHIVFVPKYRYKILKGDLGKYVYQSIYAHTERAGCEVIESLKIMETEQSEVMIFSPQ